MAKFEDLLPPDSQIAAMMGAIDGAARASSRLMMLQNIQQPFAGNAEERHADHEAPNGIPSASAAVAETRGASEARCLAGHDEPLVALRDAGWLLPDALEFSTAYCTCNA
ncbi:hypothetical protein PPMP20_18325 [Paraburkholderia phymatum]|uniref:hypothetical protein n=1 Tax=Paraburkholderia phymatum TaxID=148447 RepID=UPI001ABA1773|nr:hypothetical protein [Paraburkholderia phymatum]